MQKVIQIMIIICFVILLKLAMTFIANLNLIDKYKRNIYETSGGNVLYFLNYPESYIAYYNNGNLNYKNGEYEKSITLYREALKLDHPLDDRDCSIKINLALAMLHTFDLEDLTISKVNEILKKLDEADEVLLEAGCAKTLSEGHSKDAITIRKEIDDLRKQLKNLEPQSEKISQNNQEKKPRSENDQKKEEAIKELQNKSNFRRQSETANSKIDYENINKENIW